MKRLQQQKGFTLVELAIVLTIIGLLIGGILKGQALIANARVTAQMAQIKGFEAAVTTFNDTYSGLPGDLNSAQARIPNCSAATFCFDGSGAGTVGPTVALPATTPNPAAVAAPPATAAETANFWVHLAQANLISGVAPLGVTAVGTGNIPFAKVNSSAGVIVTQLGPATGLSGIYLTITMTNAAANMGFDSNGAATAGANPMSASQAAQIDRKMDDGNPATGNVVAYGDKAGFAAAPAAGCMTAAAGIYNEGSAGADCGLNFFLQ